MNANQIARCVVYHLPGWTYLDNGSYVETLQRSDGAKIFLRVEGGRLKVSGFYPVDVGPYNQPKPTITVSADRAPKAIAAQIQRRFLPGYDTLYAEAVAVQERDRRTFVWEVQTSQRLAGQLGARYATPQHPDERKPAYLTFGDLSLSFRAKAYDRTVELERARIPVALFERLAAVIAAWIQEQGATVQPEQ